MNHNKPVLVFDVIETIFSLDALSRSFVSEGLSAHTKDVFFAQLLRDAFATSATGAYVPFVEMARGTLQVLLTNAGVSSPESATDRILPVFSQLEAHPDVKEALALAKDRGFDVLFFTNGSKHNTDALVENNGLGDWVDHIFSIDDCQEWKPKEGAYRSAVESIGREPADCAMIAAHAWDTSGAMNAGMLAGWVRRQDQTFHPAMTKPPHMSNNLVELVSALAAPRYKAGD
ncbi:haloacid dehalogenase type II [Marinobacter sp. C2H3]|uniref:haloacid dehalogenase type II n=1 Tax=Marinobacter sp. C2H3 TaxID=3119003 RepID=UPI00300F5245